MLKFYRQFGLINSVGVRQSKPHFPNKPTEVMFDDSLTQASSVSHVTNELQVGLDERRSEGLFLSLFLKWQFRAHLNGQQHHLCWARPVYVIRSTLSWASALKMLMGSPKSKSKWEYYRISAVLEQYLLTKLLLPLCLEESNLCLESSGKELLMEQLIWGVIHCKDFVTTLEKIPQDHRDIWEQAKKREPKTLV